MPEDNSLFYTDDISYIVGIHKNLSWIWTNENISLEKIKEIVKILKNKNTCILYTESNNYNANHLYENLGYIKKDTLIEFNISY